MNIRTRDNIGKEGKRMEMIYASAEDLIGGTPLLEAGRIEKALNLKARLLLKLEYLNPAGSTKDRAALSLVTEAEKCGDLKEGGIIIEPTSGNTGIGLALVCAIRGYRLILTMPETMSAERIKILKAYGAEIVLTDGEKGMAGAILKAQELLRAHPGSFIAGQFDNSDNPAAHYKTTGPEILNDTEGHIDIFVAGVGTGGTFTGTVRYLKEHKKNLCAIAVEPETSAVISGEEPGPHNLQGIGAGFVPKNFDRTLCDKVVRVRDEDAIETGKMLGKTEGILNGISSGAALFAAIEEAKKEENAGKTIVVMMPDSGDRYYSTELFEN